MTEITEQDQPGKKIEIAGHEVEVSKGWSTQNAVLKTECPPESLPDIIETILRAVVVKDMRESCTGARKVVLEENIALSLEMANNFLQNNMPAILAGEERAHMELRISLAKSMTNDQFHAINLVDNSRRIGSGDEKEFLSYFLEAMTETEKENN